MTRCETTKRYVRSLWMGILLLLAFLINFTPAGVKATAEMSTMIQTSIDKEMAVMDAPYTEFMTQKEGITIHE